MDSDLEMQQRPDPRARSHGGSALAGRDLRSLRAAQRFVVTVAAQESVCVLDDDELAVADDAAARVHAAPRSRGATVVADLPADVDALRRRRRIAESRDDRAR